MDVDNPVVGSGVATLKRSSSAPMINELSSAMTTVTSTPTTPRDTQPFQMLASRTRRFSASFSPVSFASSSSSSTSSGPRLTPRISQLRQEEGVDLAGREAAIEKEVQCKLQMSQSWEDLTLTDMDSKSDGSRRRSPMDPLHLHLPPLPPMCSSPSPTRGLSSGRQCFSPSMQMSVRSPFSPTLSPSPTRKTVTPRRSLSPVVRPSSLGSTKRKCDMEDSKMDCLSPPPKRINASYYSIDRGGLLMPHSLTNSLDCTSSPAPGSLSSVGTPESLSSADSPGFVFRPVDSPERGNSTASNSRTLSRDEPMVEEPTPLSEQAMQVSSPVGQGPS